MNKCSGFDKVRQLTVIVVTNLLFILGLGMNNNLGEEVHKDVFEELWCHDHLRPVMAFLKDVQYVTCTRLVSGQ